MQLTPFGGEMLAFVNGAQDHGTTLGTNKVSLYNRFTNVIVYTSQLYVVHSNICIKPALFCIGLCKKSLKQQQSYKKKKSSYTAYQHFMKDYTSTL